jgi:hypothetical protein
MKHLPPSGSNDLRALPNRIESDMVMWAKGYAEISQRQLDQLLHVFTKAVTLADDPARSVTLQTMILQLEGVQTALQNNDPVAPDLAQKIIEDLHEMRLAMTSPLRPVAIEEVLGTQVIHFHYGLSTIGQVVRFRPANRSKRAFGFIGEVIILPCDDQQVMKNLFQEIYPQNDFQFLFDLYHWPEDLPAQTFQEPGRPTDLVAIQWANHQGQDDEDDEDEVWEEEATGIPEEFVLVKTIKERDRRIGMRAFSPREEMRGFLVCIDVFADGFERWTVIGDDGKTMIDDADVFWLEISQYPHLFPVRVLDHDAIAKLLREALTLYEEKEELDDHDEILQFHRRLDSLLKFLSGDLEDERQRSIAKVYQEMLYSGSLHDIQREALIRQTAAEISRLRRI